MSSSKKITFSSGSSSTSGRAHYKSTRTVTDANGNKHTETLEMFDDDAVKFMRDLHANRHDVPDLNEFGFRPMLNPRNPPKHEQHVDQNRRFLKPKPTHEPSSASSQSKNDFYQEALQVHNEYRQRHGVEPLRLNDDLCKLAQKWADHLAATGGFEHSKTQYRNVKVGENLYGQSWPSIKGKEMTKSWYDEIHQYNYRNPTFQSGTGHFTQVVWKGSQEVGFAQAKGASMTIGVAMYYPPGNYMGEFDKNVLPPR